MVTSRTLGLAESKEWKTYYDRLDAGPYHTPEYIDLLTGRLERETDARLFVYEEAGELVYYPYLLRPVETLPFSDDLSVDPSPHRDIVSSWYYGGPLTTDPEGTVTNGFDEAFREHCKRAGIVAEFVRFDPNVGNHEWFPELEPEFDRETVWVDLTQSADDIWDGFETRNRNAIRQARETDLEVEPTRNSSDYEAFYDIYSNAMAAKDATEQYRFSLKFFEDVLSRRDLASLLVARSGDEVVGGSMLVHDDEIAHDYLRASNPDYWDKRVNNLLCYEALEYMRETGRERFDFQGGRPGVFKFKKSFSPDRGRFHVARRVHMPSVYDDICGAAERAGIETNTDYFPAYRRAQSN